MSLIEDAATAAWDATFPTIPREERSSLPEDFASVARAVLASLPRHRDAIARAIDPAIAEPGRSALMKAWRDAGLDAEKYMAEAVQDAESRADAVIARLTRED